MKKNYGIHWFRRDLRINGNPALQQNWSKHNGCILGIFFIDSSFLARDDFSHNRFGFFLRTLLALQEELALHGGELLVLDSPAILGFEKIFTQFSRLGIDNPKTISFNRDYEPFARKRDDSVLKMLKKYQIDTITAKDHLIFEPNEIAKPDGGIYQIYTPFAKKWLEKWQNDTETKIFALSQQKSIQFLQNRIANPDKINKIFQLNWSQLLGNHRDELGLNDQLSLALDKNKKRETILVPPAGPFVAFSKLKNFARSSLMNYGTNRDIPSLAGTSEMSIYLKNGSFTTSQVISLLKIGEEFFGAETGSQKYLKEIIWREFYYHILWHRPEVEKQAFQKKYSLLNWENKEAYFEAWKRGETGYPIIDAGMRQLLQTGWMHNRVRMVVASFLTKDLLIDWRWGEKWFMENLLDGDLAPNNGGWQWAASTGCDPQPYFRVFNPELQSQKFDPEGLYIKKYVPELKHVSAKEIHNPPHPMRKGKYPAPIVNHAAQKLRALELFQEKNK